MRTIGEALFIFLLQMLLVVVVHAAEKPLIYWPMDEGAGEVICDTGSNGFVGELHDVTWVEGRYGKAVYFNGEGAYIDCGNSPQMDLKDCFTIDFWLRPDKQSGGNKRIISKGDKSTGNARGYQYLIFQGSAGTDTQNIHLYISNGKSITELSAPLQLGIWQHFVAVWDGINVSLFMNGRCFGRKPFTGPLNLSNSDINLLMGSLRGNDAFWRGALDEVKLYDSAISEVSITEDKVRLSREQIMLLEKTVSGMEADIKTLLKRKSSYSLYPRIYEYVMNMKRKLEVVKESNGQINLAEAGEWEKEIPAELASLKKMVSYMAKNKSGDKNIRIFTVEPISNKFARPDSFIIPGEESGRVTLSASPGEYEPGSIVIYASKDVDGLRLVSTDMRSQSGKIIPAACVDIKTVKWWYQSGQGTNIRQGRFFLPELLLNDDALVTVDHNSRDNYLKLRLADCNKYVCISKEEALPGIGGSPEIGKFPVKDADKLQPVSIKAESNRQFWITVAVPENAEPGLYRGKILLQTGKVEQASVSLEINVLPIKLAEAYYVSSIYYRGILHHGPGTVSSEKKNAQQLKAELKDLYAHGITNPICYQPFEPDLLGDYLNIRKSVGIKGPLYYLGFNTSVENYAENPEKLKDKVRKLVAFVKQYGVDEVYIYGEDEAKGEKLSRQRELWQAVHEAGARVFVAGYRNSSFTIMGDIQDLLICAFAPSREEAERWHAKGHRIWCYSNPQGGIEEPEIYRRNYGLLLWQNDYDGAATYAYQNGDVGNLTWNDFEKARDNNYRHHNMTYPTADGVIDTIQFEGYREGVDDIRYLTTLLREVDKARKLQKEGSERDVVEAENYLRWLKNADLVTTDLNSVRERIKQHILKLTKN